MATTFSPTCMAMCPTSISLARITLRSVPSLNSYPNVLLCDPALTSRSDHDVAVVFEGGTSIAYAVRQLISLPTDPQCSNGRFGS